MNCGPIRINDPAEIIKAPWVRPEDIKHLLDAGVQYIKLAGRGQPTDWILQSAEAYSRQSFDGNIYSLIEKQGLCSAEYDLLLENKEALTPFRFSIDNRSMDGFIDPFVEGKMNCEMGCDGCNYCSETAKRVVEFNSELANQHKERLQSAKHALTSSKFIQPSIYNNLQAQHANQVTAEA
jgi:collagenase-like PrtC family protease